MNKVIIREAVFDDAAQIATVHIETWQTAYQGQIPDSYLNSLDVATRTENGNISCQTKNRSQ